MSLKILHTFNVFFFSGIHCPCCDTYKFCSFYFLLDRSSILLEQKSYTHLLSYCLWQLDLAELHISLLHGSHHFTRLPSRGWSLLLDTVFSRSKKFYLTASFFLGWTRSKINSQCLGIAKFGDILPNCFLVIVLFECGGVFFEIMKKQVCKKFEPGKLYFMITNFCLVAYRVVLSRKL